MADQGRYLPRLADRALADRIAQFPAVLINGPRAVGKTTTARQLAADVVRLDQPAQAAIFQADPDAALRARTEPLLLDEWQAVPEVLGAVKRAVDDDYRPGRFILTGSVRGDLEGQAWPGTGRLLRLAMYGLTEREVMGNLDGADFVTKLSADDPEAFSVPSSPPDIVDYVDLAVRGGFPEVVFGHSSPASRDIWLDSYLAQLVARDAATVDPRRDPERLRRYFEALALCTAGIPNRETLLQISGVNAKTATAYDDLFAHLFIADRLPAWSTNRLSRLVSAPKRYIVDPALAAAVSGTTAATILADGGLLGRFFDTFAVAQIRPEIALAARRARLYHLRTEGGRQEIDLIIELPGRKVVAIEFKAAATVGDREARHLRWLRDRLDDGFVAGAVIHAGPACYRLDDRILAVPLCALWT